MELAEIKISTRGTFVLGAMKRSRKDLHDIAYADMEVACMAYGAEEESPDALDAREDYSMGALR